MMTQILKSASTVTTTERCAAMMRQALLKMNIGAPGPGYLGIRHDVLNGKVEAAKVSSLRFFRVRGKFIRDPSDLARAADAIARAERPVALMGTQARA